MEPQLKDHYVACVPKLQFSAGFTIIEILIVLAILGIIAMLGLPALNATLEDTRLRGAAEEVVTALEYAQLTAMTSGSETRVIIKEDVDHIEVKQYKINADLFTGGDKLDESSVENGSYTNVQYPLNKGVDYKVRLKEENRFQGIDITTSDFNSTDPVNFNSMGAPSKGGTVALALGSSQIVVTLDALTGKVSVSN